MDVPDDIRKAALKCIADYWEPNGQHSLDTGIARALMAEREQCAKIADEHRALIPNHEIDGRQHPDHHSQGYGNAAFNIASAIRRGTP